MIAGSRREVSSVADVPARRLTVTAERRDWWVIVGMSVAVTLALLLYPLFPDARDEYLLLVIIAVIFAGSAVFGDYHAGVEWGFWPGPTSCTGTGSGISFGDLDGPIEDGGLHTTD